MQYSVKKKKGKERRERKKEGGYFEFLSLLSKLPKRVTETDLALPSKTLADKISKTRLASICQNLTSKLKVVTGDMDSQFHRICKIN